jgi:DTW domain-containing protein YfiP
MSGRRAGNPNRCPECKVNSLYCVCNFISPLEISSHISLIVHVRELKLTSNTAQFVHKLLPHNSHIEIRGRVNENFSATSIMQKEGRPIFLYPHEDAIELSGIFTEVYPGPYNLIVPDGNWHQARRVKRREAQFDDVMAVKLPPGIRTEYGLRRAPQVEWVSTYEAVAHALGILENNSSVRDHMMDFFRKWVHITQLLRAGGHEPKE